MKISGVLGEAVNGGPVLERGPVLGGVGILEGPVLGGGGHVLGGYWGAGIVNNCITQESQVVGHLKKLRRPLIRARAQYSVV